MGSDHFFAELHAHSRKLYKFQQRKSVPDDLGAEYSGACLSIALMWIHEKITTSNNILSRTFQERRFVSSASGDTHARNAHISSVANSYHSRLTNGADISPVEHAIGLVPINSLNAELKRVKGPAPSHLPVVDLAGTLVNAANNLQSGYAACLEIELFKSGYSVHAVGIYRSRGGTLHFFCPNAGEYEVINPEGFFEAYIAGCERRGWEQLSPKIRYNNDASWCHFYSR